jgi:phage gp45-like
MSAIKRLIRWCRVTRATQKVGATETGPFPNQQVSYLGKLTNSVAWYPYGFHAVAPDDALALMLTHAGGNQNHFPGSPRQRILIEDGEVVVYHPLTGSKVHFKANGDIDVDAGTANVNVTAAEVNVTTTGNTTLTVEGNLRTKSDSTRFQNAAGTDDLHDAITDFMNLITSTYTGQHSANFRNSTQLIQDRIDALR